MAVRGVAWGGCGVTTQLSRYINSQRQRGGSSQVTVDVSVQRNGRLHTYRIRFLQLPHIPTVITNADGRSKE